MASDAYNERLGRAIIRQRGRCEQCGVALAWETCEVCDQRGYSAIDGETCPNCAGNGGYWAHVGEPPHEQGKGD